MTEFKYGFLKKFDLWGWDQNGGWGQNRGKLLIGWEDQLPQKMSGS